MPPVQLPPESIDMDWNRRGSQYSSVPSAKRAEELGKSVMSQGKRPKWIHVLMGAVGVISVAIVLLLIAGTRPVA